MNIDPDATLDDILAAAQHIIDEASRPGKISTHTATDLAEQVLALSTHLVDGGRLPHWWEQNDEKA